MSVSDRPTPDGEPNVAHTGAHNTRADATVAGRYIEIWNDLVSVRDLTWSIVICGGTTALALGIATAFHSDEFFWGLGGAVLGFTISALVFTPKRTVTVGQDVPDLPDGRGDA
ncbi:hypothetical protein [uncultured Corynebacterium sp.]|uniref:hypothetical protein n=1 Tax=uncultured Corynebacterium sp. TaxID=159447 RepID=UPI0025EF0D70|nr:hypothetical protein [uncultured Corynebacterium sp.]